MLPFREMAIACFIGLATAACSDSEDATCPTPPFDDPAIGITRDGPDTLLMVLRTPTTDDLSDGYYQRAFVYETSPELHATIESAASHSFFVRIDQLPRCVDSSCSAELSVGFPDTRHEVACNHPGSDDVYGLHIDLKLAPGPKVVVASVTGPIRLSTGPV